MAKGTKNADLRAKSNEELRHELAALQRELFNLRMQHAIQSLPKHSQLRRAKRDIARLLTIITEKESA